MSYKFTFSSNPRLTGMQQKCRGIAWVVHVLPEQRHCYSLALIQSPFVCKPKCICLDRSPCHWIICLLLSSKYGGSSSAAAWYIQSHSGWIPLVLFRLRLSTKWRIILSVSRDCEHLQNLSMHKFESTHIRNWFLYQPKTGMSHCRQIIETFKKIEDGAIFY